MLSANKKNNRNNHKIFTNNYQSKKIQLNFSFTFDDYQTHQPAVIDLLNESVKNDVIESFEITRIVDHIKKLKDAKSKLDYINKNMPVVAIGYQKHKSIFGQFVATLFQYAHDDMSSEDAALYEYFAKSKKLLDETACQSLIALTRNQIKITCQTDKLPMVKALVEQIKTICAVKLNHHQVHKAPTAQRP